MGSSSSTTKRTWRIVGVVLISLMVSFVAIGFVFPSVTVETASRTDRSPYVAFHVLTDSDSLREWMEGFVSLNMVLDRGEQIGNTSVLQVVSGRDTLEMRQEIVEYKLGEQFTITFESEMALGEIDVQLIPVSQGTELFVRSRFEGSNWFWRSVFPLFKSEIKATQRADYDRLVTVINRSLIPIEGNWAGIDAEGNEQLFRFKENGRLDWKAALGDQRFELSALQFEIDRTMQPVHVNLSGFADPPLEGMVMYGIIDFVSDDSLRIDLEAASPGNDSARPSEFSDSAVELRRIR